MLRSFRIYSRRLRPGAPSPCRCPRGLVESPVHRAILQIADEPDVVRANGGGQELWFDVESPEF